MTTAPDADASLQTPEEEELDYRQEHPLQIATCLRALMTRHERLTVEFDGRQFVSQVLDVDAHKSTFIFDSNHVEADRLTLLDVDELTFRNLPGAMHTHFTTGSVRRVWFEDQAAFEASFPAVLFYVQRREFFRVKTPVIDPFVALSHAPDGGSFQLELQDLSLGGVALTTYDARFNGIEIGSVLHDVALQLGNFGSLSVTLEVVSPRQAKTDAGDLRYVISCRFVERTAVAERVLQRVITQLENKRRTLEPRS